MKIYTKKGDLGQTSLVNGKRVNKNDLRIHCYGTVDELNSHIGVLLTTLEQAEVIELRPHLTAIQSMLFQLGSQLACSDDEMAEKLPTIHESDIQLLETNIDAYQSELPELRNFILPGGSFGSAQAHICRTVTRRAERLCTELNSQEVLSYPAISFLNRLSDYFFVLARLINHRLGIASPEWKA